MVGKTSMYVCGIHNACGEGHREIRKEDDGLRAGERVREKEKSSRGGGDR